MIRIHQVYLRNWRRVREATVAFPDVGTVAVLGIDGVNGSYLKSVGTGKTSLGEAVSRAVFGVPTKPIGKMSFKRKGDTYVRVEATIDGKPFTVETGYKCDELGGAGEGLRFTVDGETTQRADAKDTRAELNAMLGISEDLATWTVFLNGDKLKFSELSQADQVKLLMQALRQPPWPSYLVVAKKRATQAREREAQAQGELEATHTNIASTQDEVKQTKEIIAELEKRYNEVLAKYDKENVAYAAALKEVQLEDKRCRTLVHEKKKAYDAAVTEAYKRATDEFKTNAAEVYPLARAESRKMSGRQEVARAEYTRLKREYEKFDKQPDICPTCKQKWPADEHIEAERNRAYDALAESYDAYLLSVQEAEKALAEEKEAADAVEDMNRKIDDRADELVRSAKEAHDAAEIAYGKVGEKLYGLEDIAPEKPDAGELEQAQSKLLAEWGLLERMGKQLEKAAQAVVEAERDHAIKRYWIEALGPTGIPNHVINQALPPLNAAADAASTALTGGVIGVKFGTTCELASGEERNKVTVYVDNPRGADELGEFSKGEGGLTNLIISESLSMIGQLPHRCSWRWLDEAINNQDRKHVYGYYKRLAHANNMAVFIVDHHPDALAMADHVLVATKDEAGFTSYTWEQ